MGVVVGPLTIDTDQLRPLPASLVKLATLVADPNASGRDFEEVIALDEALTAVVLRLANSAWSNPAHEITDVRTAVMRVGAAHLLRVAMGRELSPMMARELAEYDLAENELWHHSVAAALAAENLGRVARAPVPTAAFTAALLHDIGKLFLGRMMGAEKIASMRRLVAECDVDWVEAERTVFGVSHAEVGGAVARHWSFPEILVQAIERHHEPDVEACPIADAVHVANAVAKIIGVGIGIEQFNITLSESATERLGLTQAGFEELCARVADDLEEALAQYRLGDG